MGMGGPQNGKAHLPPPDALPISPRDVLTDPRPELDPLGRAPAGDPDVVEAGVVVHNGIADHAALVMAGVGLDDGGVLEIGESLRHERARSFQRLRRHPPDGEVRIQLRGWGGWWGRALAGRATRGLATSRVLSAFGILAATASANP